MAAMPMRFSSDTTYRNPVSVQRRIVSIGSLRRRGRYRNPRQRAARVGHDGLIRGVNRVGKEPSSRAPEEALVRIRIREEREVLSLWITFQDLFPVFEQEI